MSLGQKYSKTCDDYGQKLFAYDREKKPAIKSGQQGQVLA